MQSDVPILPTGRAVNIFDVNDDVTFETSMVRLSGAGANAATWEASRPTLPASRLESGAILSKARARRSSPRKAADRSTRKSRPRLYGDRARYPLGTASAGTHGCAASAVTNQILIDANSRPDGLWRP